MNCDDMNNQRIEEYKNASEVEKAYLKVLQVNEALQLFKDRVKELGNKLRKIDNEILATFKDGKLHSKEGFELSQLRLKIDRDLEALAVSE